MFKRILTITLTFLIINLSLTSIAFAETKEEKEAKFAEKVKTQITKLGTGKDAKVEVKLKDSTKLKGFVSKIGDESFVVTNDKTGDSTEIPYPQTKQVKGNNLSNGAKILIGVGLIVAFTVILYVAGRSD